MNAKKIMGAVLVALLAAALFVGAGAAADVEDIGPVFTYTKLNAWEITPGMSFTAADGTVITAIGDAEAPYFAYEGEYLGKTYVKGLEKFTLVAPTATISAVDVYGASIIGKTITKTDAPDQIFTVVSPIFPDAEVVFIKDGVYYKAEEEEEGEFTMPADIITSGKWGVAAVITGCENVTTEAPLYGQVAYFTIAKTDVAITAAKDTINIGETVIINVVAPGKQEVTVKFDTKKVKPVEGQAGVEDNENGTVTITLGLDGTGSAAFEAFAKGKATFTLGENEVDVTIEKGVITAVADEDFFYIGKPIALSGTTTAGETLFFYIEGTNFAFMNLNDIEGIFAEDLEVENGAWTVEINSDKIVNENDKMKELVAGTYTIVIATKNYTEDDVEESDYDTLKELVMSGVYGTAAVTMTQPFITDIKANAVAVQGTDYKITGTAIAAEEVRLYIFGTSFFAADVDDNLDEDGFEFEILGADLEKMAPGTYFYLIQHPMNDGVFNVWNESAKFYYAATEPGVTAESHDGNAAAEGIFLFDAWKRGTNYAAQALLEAIAGQDIDDIFVQGTFEVEAQKLTINPIPAEVAKGTKLAITGSSNSGEGVEVIVNVLAGKFGATVKGDENAATFLTAKAVTEEDGTFEAAIDTSKLEVGNYIVTVEIGGQMYDSAAVEIVEKAPVTPPADDKPDTPVTPPADDKPTEPETPGFGALAALAGLGAVAVLLLRRE